MKKLTNRPSWERSRWREEEEVEEEEKKGKWRRWRRSKKGRKKRGKGSGEEEVGKRRGTRNGKK